MTTKRFPLPFALLALATALLLLAGCPGGGPGGDDDDDDDASGGPIDVEMESECENINPLYCLMPWPSSRYLEVDDTTETGWRVDYEKDAFPLNINDVPFNTIEFERQDGFPASAQILTVFDAPIDASNLPPWWDMDLSLADDSPTVVLDMDSGERVAHFSEFDVGYDDPSEITMYIRPAKRLAENKRYAIAIRDLEYEDGGAPAASPMFAALRDGVTTTSNRIEERRPAFEEIFTALEGAGVVRDELIQAWDFHTASSNTAHGDMLYMRDDALDRVGAEGLACDIDSIVEDYDNNVYRLVRGTVTVPWYMDSAYPPARIERDDEGNPEYTADVEVSFALLIPNSLNYEGYTPGRLVQFGHSFFASEDEMLYDFAAGLADDLEMVMFATAWAGMSDADLVATAGILANVSEAPLMADRLRQGMVSQLVVQRTIAGICAEEEAFQLHGQLAYDPSETFFLGVSQGGILGGTSMALSTDVERGVLNVGGVNLSVLQSRSQNFTQFDAVYATWYPRRMDREFYWSLMGHLMETADPVAYMPHLLEDPFPGTPPKKIIYQAALNDGNVSNVATNMGALAAGMPQLAPGENPVWGLEEASSDPYDGSAIQYWDFGVSAAPPGNEPANNQVHGMVLANTEAKEQIDAFLAPGGQVINFCDGECDPH